MSFLELLFNFLNKKPKYSGFGVHVFFSSLHITIYVVYRILAGTYISTPTYVVLIALKTSVRHRLVLSMYALAIREVEEFNYVSFKLNIPIDKFGALIDPSLWPSTIAVREFTNRGRFGAQGSFLH